MRLSNQSKSVIEQIGQSIGGMFAIGLTPLQILILCEVRYRESISGRTQHVFTDHVRISIRKMLQNNGGGFNPSRQSFWNSFKSLQAQGFLFIAPPAKNTWKRGVAITVSGATLFHYPKTIHPFQKFPTTENHEL